jgi:hypothetical protein
MFYIDFHIEIQGEPAKIHVQVYVRVLYIDSCIDSAG